MTLPMFEGETFGVPGIFRIVFAFDFGTTTGWSVQMHMPTGRVHFVASGQHEMVKRAGKRWSDFDSLIAELYERYWTRAEKPNCASRVVFAYEDVPFVEGEAWTRIYYAQRAILEMAAYEYEQTDVVAVSTRDVKARLTGDAKADKGACILSAEGMLGRAVRGDHEADSLGVGLRAGDQCTS